MKVLLVNPSCVEDAQKEFIAVQYPINLGIIAAVLIKAGHEVKMFDFNVEKTKDFWLFLKDFNPEIIGFSSVTPTIYHVKELAKRIKEENKKAITILGGIHASALPEQTMQEIPDIDYLIYGEGELTIVELLDKLNKKEDLLGVMGLVVREGKEIIKNPPRPLIEDLDSLPYPNRDLVDIKKYKKSHVVRGFSRRDMNIAEIIINRGCIGNCIFCASHINYGRRIRFRSYENVIGEINELIEKYNIRYLDIEDDTFTIKKDIVLKLCAFLKEKKLLWGCCARVDTVDPELLKVMADSGCKSILYGVEVGSNKAMKEIKKGITIERVKQAVKESKAAGVRYIETDFMIASWINESEQDIKETEQLIHEIKPDFISLCVACAYPGTELFSQMKSCGYLDENPDWSQFTVFGKFNRNKGIANLTSEQMIKAQSRILKGYYLNPKYMLRQIKQIRSFSEVKYFVRMGFSFLKEFYS